MPTRVILSLTGATEEATGGTEPYVHLQTSKEGVTGSGCLRAANRVALPDGIA